MRRLHVPFASPAALRAPLSLGLLFAIASGCTPPAAPPNAPPPNAKAPPSSSKSTDVATPDKSHPEGRSTGYDKPPQAILDVMRAPSPPSARISPTGTKMLLVSMVEYPSMERVAEPFLRLAGVRVEPRNHSKHDTPGGYGIRPCVREMSVFTIASGSESKIRLPEGSCASTPHWSADGNRFFFENAMTDSVQLWVGDAGSGEAHAIPGVRLNPIFDDAADWLADQKSLIVKLVPDNLGPPPPKPEVPIGPSIQEANGEKGESSTYETRDTLKDKHDEALFDYYGTSQLAVVDVTSNAVKRVGAPAIYTSVDRAPDGVHVLVEAIKRPYSYITTADRFPHDVSVLDLSKNDAHVIASLPLADRVPVHGVPMGPRHFSWRATEPATLLWAEALDGGDWKAKVPARDKVMTQKAPFSSPPVELLRTEQRYAGVGFGTNPGAAFLYEHDENRHWRRVFTFDIDTPKTKPAVLFDLSTDEKYKNPGGFVHKQLPNGAWVVRQEGDVVYLSGQGASPTGDRPFLDRLNLKTKKTDRLFRSGGDALEHFLAFASQKPAESSILTWRQSPTDPPNAFSRTIGAEVKAPEGEASFASTPTAITHLPDPTPAVRAIKKRLVTYKRKDGVELSFSLYTPPDYKEGTRVPAILNAYPLDYADAKKAGQISGSDLTFTRLRQYQLLLLAGYAIIDRAAFPIVGDPKKAYDTYLEQLVSDAKAAVDKAVELGVVDPDRIGVTGHSHGALMTANLLAHSDLFRAGVATSGSYNKTLTPFGFQNERRSVWEAQNVYLKASPFFFADKMKLPLLIVHGEDDANPGTTPLQATKLYEALRGNGGTTRLVMLPHEPHWYTAMESNEQLVAEMLRWFDKHVKSAPPRKHGAAPTANAAPNR